MSRVRKEKNKPVLRGLLVIFVFITVIAFAFSGKSDKAEPTVPVLSTEAVPEAEPAQLEIYYLDVDQGDCALVICDGKAMLIDGGSSSQSRKVYSFLQAHGINHLDYIIASHADADHVGGLAAALNYAKADAALCTVTSHDTKPFNSFLKYLDKQGISINVPDAGDTYSLGSASFTIIGPEKGVIRTNNSSLIIRVEYGETSFLFTGDAEYDDEQAAIDSGFTLKSTVLKVAHHGSSSSSSYSFIYNVQPQYAVISVGGKNSYGHPSDNVLSRLRDSGATVMRTDMQGDIHCTSDGKTVKFDVQKNPDIDTTTFPGGYSTR